MKCPVCWAEKAYIRRVNGWKGIALACLLIVPMKCHHCYHKFHVSWFTTLGKSITPPPLRIAPISRSRRPSHAARHVAAAQVESQAEGSRPLDSDLRRADAA